MQTVERTPVISAGTTTAVIEAITAAGFDIVRRPRIEAVPRGVVRRATFGHRYLADEAGDGSGYRRRGE